MILAVAAKDMNLKPGIYAMINLPYIFHSHPENSPINRRARSSTFLKATTTNSQKYKKQIFPLFVSEQRCRHAESR